MRLASAFAPQWLPADQQQLLYFATDIFLLTGLFALYARYAVAVGWIGLAGFATALAGFCTIRTQTLLGVPTYPIGGALCLFGMAFIGARMPAEPGFPHVAPLLWMAALVIGVAGAYWPMVAWGVIAAGVVFALGFIAAGVVLIQGAARA
jgi:hypothetical protein